MTWYPRDLKGGRPVVGDIVAYAFRPHTVVDIRHDVQHSDYPGDTFTVYRLRPVDATTTDGANRDVHRGYRGYRHPSVLEEHYSLCHKCGDLPPCREIHAERIAAKQIAEMERYETPGVCPHCKEIVTHRQERETFPNVVIPGGPAVTFHAGRRACRRAMEEYRKRLDETETQMTIGDDPDD